MQRALSAVIILALASACASTTRGEPARAPAATGKLFASTGVTAPEGLVVLLNGPTSGGDESYQAWSASDEVELDVLWHGVRPGGRPPAVDFERYVVLGFAHEGGVCSVPIVGVEAETSGLLTLKWDEDRLVSTCIMVATRVAEVVAIPRRVLPGPIVYLWNFRFVLSPRPGT